MSGAREDAAQIIGGNVDIVSLNTGARMSNSATRLLALERFVVEMFVEAGLHTWEGPPCNPEDIRAEMRRRAELRLAQLQHDASIPWPNYGGAS